MFERSVANLGWLNFFVALLTGSGAFLAVYLTTHHWDQIDIGLALGAASVTATLCQVPAGAILDAVPSKRSMAGLAVVMFIVAGVLVAVTPLLPVVIGAQILLGIASTVLAPAIAAITLTLAQQDRLGERLGTNVRFQAIGNCVATAGLALVGFMLPGQAVFLLSAACGIPAILALRRIEAGDMAEAATRTAHLAALPPRLRRVPPRRARQMLLDWRLMVFGAALALFQLSNAAVLPIASNTVARMSGSFGYVFVAGSVLLPQALAAIISPYLGRSAQAWGRRPILILGFVALPLRVALFYIDPDPYRRVLYQSLDGVSSSVIGVMVPLVVSDITHRGGRFNFAMGLVGLAGMLGAALSNPAAGLLASMIGNLSTFAALAAAGVAATLVVTFLMPETKSLCAEPGQVLSPA